MKFLDLKNNYLIDYDENYFNNDMAHLTVVEKIDKTEEEEFEIMVLTDLFKYIYSKENIRKRKFLYKSKKGVSTNDKKNSLNRDKNNTISQLYLNVTLKNGLRLRYLKYFNEMVENFYSIFNENTSEFNNYTDYNMYYYMINKNKEYSSFEFILKELMPNFNCLFDIRTKKNPKKLKLEKKYSHSIVYVPRERRIKKSLKAMSFYTENYKNYYMWERIFWLFLSVILNSGKSFLIKRRQYIYKKSLKFFFNKK